MIYAAVYSILGSCLINWIGGRNDWSFVRILVFCVVWGIVCGVIGGVLTELDK
jgi:hypothetical protein